MIKKLNKHLNQNEKLLKHSLLIFIAGLLAGFFNYIFQIYMGRALGPEQYGILGALFSIFYIESYAYTGIDTIITKFVSEYKAKKQFGKINSLIKRSFAKLSFYGFIGLIVYFLISKYIANFLNISNVFLVILMGVVMFLALLAIVMNGVLRGLQKFNWLAANNILTAFAKLIFGVLLVTLGFGVAGALNSLNIAFAFAILIPLIPIWFVFRYKQEPINHIDIFKYSLPIFLAAISLLLITNFDLILVKHYFSSLESGFYAAASMLAKIIWFISTALVIVMFPKIADLYEKKKDTSSLLKNSLFYTFLISFSVILVYFTAPTFISKLLYGPEYEISGLIGLFALALGFFALNNVLVYYNLAIKKTRFVIFLILILFLEIASIVLFHNTLIEVVKVVLISNIVLLVYLVFYTRKELGFKNGITA